MKPILLYKKVINYFSKHMPNAETELNYHNSFQLLVAVILSAQCTDKRVNQITPNVFKQFPDAQSMAASSQEKIFELIKTCSYPNNKAQHLFEMSKMLIKKHKGIVPPEMDALLCLPGVGRKTANVIRSVIYNEPGFAVDTHVFRVAARIGLTKKAKNPLQAEEQLTKGFPEELIPKAHHWLILHGRYVCTAKKPKCELCGLKNFCLYNKRQSFSKAKKA